MLSLKIFSTGLNDFPDMFVDQFELPNSYQNVV